MDACGKYLVDEISDLLRRRERATIGHPSFPRAAVLIPLFAKEGGCHILFTRRSDQVKHHKGQISFPGGAFDNEDEDLERTALREAFEEIGVKEKDVQVLGALDDIVTSSEFVVTPYVGIIPYPYSFQLSAVEIAELIIVPLASLLEPDSFAEREIIDYDFKKVVESYQHDRHIIWGATARILKQFLAVIAAPGPVGGIKK